MKIMIVMATRPEIMKNYSIVKELKRRKIPHVIVHTNQHSDYLMQEVFFKQMGYKANYILDGEYRFGKAVDFVTDIVKKEKPDWILVNGDTAGALVGALAAQYTDTKLAHVEAGLRSFDEFMCEERNRMAVDGMSHLLLTYTKAQADYLAKNKELRGKIKFVGNTTVDLIKDFRSEIDKAPALLCSTLAPNGYIYVTLHRKEFTDSEQRMMRVFNALRVITEKYKCNIIFPVHPRTSDCAKKFGIDIEKMCGEYVYCLNPVSAFESLFYEKNAKMILTDSGCIQEEACVFKVPCVTIRENTERQECVKAGINKITGFYQPIILDVVDRFWKKSPTKYPNLYGTYGVGKRIVNELLKY